MHQSVSKIHWGEKHWMQVVVKQCSVCNKTKPLSDYYKANHLKDGLQLHCKQCARAKQTRYRKNNPVRAWCSGTIGSHKACGYIVELSLNELYDVASTITTCPICKCKLVWSPSSKGGKVIPRSPTLDRINNQKVMRLGNVQIICHQCNHTKGTRTPEELFAWCQQYILYYYDCEGLFDFEYV